MRIRRPYDLIQPYRLCMGDKLSVGGHKDLYSFWKAVGLAQSLFGDGIDAEAAETLLVVNVASQEYSNAVDRAALPPNHLWVDVVFLDSGRILSVYAKKARGLFCRFCAINTCRTVEDLTKFNLEGYKYQSTASTPTKLVFGRPKPEPKAKKPAAKKGAKTETETKKKEGSIATALLGATTRGGGKREKAAMAAPKRGADPDDDDFVEAKLKGAGGGPAKRRKKKK